MSFEKVVIGKATLYLGDCLEIISTLKGVDAVIADPPYGINHVHSDSRGGIGNGKYRTRLNDMPIHGDDKPFDPTPLLNLAPLICLWGANHYADKLPAMPSWFVWDKRAASEHSNDFADGEAAWTNTGKPLRIFRHHWDGMMKASEQGVARVHPTQKPIALMKWCIKQLGNPSVILDPYMGSGSTGVAAVDMGLTFIGCEIDPKNFDIACERIEDTQAATGKIKKENPKGFLY